MLIWLIGGEKRLAVADDMISDSSCWAIMVFNALLWIDEKGELKCRVHSNFDSRDFEQ